MLFRFWQASLQVYYREVQRDRKPTGCLELHGRRGSLKGLKYPRKTLVGETPGPWKEGHGPIGRQLGKRPIESGMPSGGSDTIPRHVPAQGTQLRSWRRLGQLSRTAKRRISIFCRPHGHLYLLYPRERGQSHRSIRLHQSADAESLLRKSAAATDRSGSEREQPSMKWSQ